MAHSLVNLTAKSRIRKASWLWLPLVLAGVTVCSSGAWAQEWIPYQCCPNTDCQQANSTSVTEVRGGYTVEGVEGVVAYDDPRVQPSQDGQYHACIRSQARPYMDQTHAVISGQASELKCLFVPFVG